MDMPFASYWKIENDLWCWYYNKEASRVTPFGIAKAPIGTTPASSPATSAPDITSRIADAPKMIAALQSAVKLDRNQVELSNGKTVSIKVTNALPGIASLSVSCPNKPLAETGITPTFDKPELKSNETATLTLAAGPNVKPGTTVLQVTVAQTNQVLDLSVNVPR